MAYKDKNDPRDKASKLKYYYANKDKYRATNKRNREQRKQWYLELMATKACVKCGESDIACLDWHHTDPSKKEAEVSKIVNRLHKMDSVLEEMAKCVILCSNCHRKLHAGRFELEE